jgi:hypothetical protein
MTKVIKCEQVACENLRLLMLVNTLLGVFGVNDVRTPDFLEHIEDPIEPLHLHPLPF